MDFKNIKITGEPEELTKLEYLLEDVLDIGINTERKGNDLYISYDYLEIARKRHKTSKANVGRKRKDIDPEEIKEKMKTMTAEEIAEELNISKRTLFRRLKELSNS